MCIRGIKFFMKSMWAVGKIGQRWQWTRNKHKIFLPLFLWSKISEKKRSGNKKLEKVCKETTRLIKCFIDLFNKKKSWLSTMFQVLSDALSDIQTKPQGSCGIKLSISSIGLWRAHFSRILKSFWLLSNIPSHTHRRRDC